jgi:hypothetical protein
MANDSPAVILYNNLGNPVGVVLEGVVYKLQAQVTGAAPSGSATVGNPVLVSGSDGTNVRTLRTNTDGYLEVSVNGLSVNIDSLEVTNDSIGIVGNAALASATFVAGTDGTNLRGIKTTADGTIRIDPIGTTIQPISAVSLPLPTGAATEVTLATLLTNTTFTSRINTLGQKTMVNSTPVTLASDQSALTIIGTVTSNIGTTNGLALDATVDSLLKELTFTTRTNTLGQKAMTGSMPVVISSDQSALAITGTVSATQGTSPWVISAATLPLPSGAATEVTVATLLSNSTFTTRINTLGQKTMSASTPVTMASDQGALAVSGTFWQTTQPVSGTVTANAGTGTFAISAAALPLPADAATQTTLALIKAKTDNLDVALSTRAVTGLTDAELRATAVPVSGTITANAGTGTFAVSAASLPLPSGAATETTLGTRLADATFTARINTLGQKSMANSTPVVLASNQSPIDVVVVSGEAGGSNVKVAYDIGETVIYIGEAELGSATSASVWTIKRITLVGGEPTFTEWSDGTAVWDDRATEAYS